MERIKDLNINTQEYWNKFSTDEYQEADKNRGGNKCKFLTVKDIIKENIDILDIGCFNGNFYNFLKEQNFNIKSFTGVDFSEKLIERAKNRFSEQKWIVSDYSKLPFKNETFDIITLMEILEHIDEPEKAIKEASRVCKKEGSVIITVPNRERIKDIAHVWSFSLLDILDLLSKISKNIQIILTCSNNRNIVGKAIIDYKSYF